MARPSDPRDLITGQRWTMAIARALGGGPMRFSALKSATPGISANVLTARLETLIEAGVVLRITLPPPASVPAYALSEWGKELGPILQALDLWSARHPRSSAHGGHPYAPNRSGAFL